MKWLKQKISFLLKRQLGLMVATAIIGTAMTAMAAGPSVSWTTKADFESNASTLGTPTNRSNIDTTSMPDSVKVGIPRDFATTATVTCVTASKIYTTGVTRTSISVIDAASSQVTGSIPVPNQVAGIVYDPDDNKLYVGQQNSNAVLEVDADTGAIIKTLAIGHAANGVYAATYNSTNKKVYLANTGDQTVTILDAPSDTVLQTVTVTPGATTATVRADSNVYLTGKSNNYVTVIDGTTNQVLQDIQIEPVLGILGGTAPGNVGLRLDAPALGLTGATKIVLSWNAEALGSDQNIQLQMRTAPDVASLDAATYLGPGSSADAWYDSTTEGASTVTEADGSVTTTIPVAVPFANAAELQVKLTWDGITSPVLHDVGLTYGFTITASAGVGGSIDPSGAVLVAAGASQAFNIAPETGYHILDVKVDGVSQGAISSYSFTNVRADHTIEASFERNRYTIYASAGPNGTISPSGTVIVSYGDNATFTPSADTGYHTDHVIVDGVDMGPVDSYTFNNVAADHTISVAFAINTYTITASAGTGGSITPASATVSYGGSQTFTITPSSGYVVTNVFVDGTQVGAVTSYTFSDVKANHTISASFGLSLPDLVVTALAPPATAIPGLTMTIPTTIKNIGNSSAGTFDVGFYLCPTTDINSSCINLATKIIYNGLAPGGEQAINLQAPLGTVASGNYYVVAKADLSNMVAESNESNNTLAAPTTILKGPDLIMTAVTTPATATVGQQITVPVTVKNQGIGPALNSYYVGLYLCPTNNISTSCTSLRQSLVNSLAVGAQQSFNVITTVPPVAGGTYYIGAIADSSDRNEEMDETNNALAGSPTTIK